MVALGSVPVRAPVGHGARGLLAGRRAPGIRSRTTTRGRAPTAGARTACSASATTMAGCVLPLALWNEADPILKERLFGLTGPEGNHGEDVKEYYFYLDSTPTHSYMRALYKYPQRAFPYAELVAENRRRGKDQPEYELVDTGVFADDRYFDVEVEYAKATPDRPRHPHHRDQSRTRGQRRCTCLPTLWFRNTWAWQRTDPDPAGSAPTSDRSFARLHRRGHSGAPHARRLLARLRRCARAAVHRERDQRRAAVGRRQPHAIRQRRHQRRVVNGRSRSGQSRARRAPKAAAHYVLQHRAGRDRDQSLLRLSDSQLAADPFADAEQRLALRRAEADAFYNCAVRRADTMSAGRAPRPAPGLRGHAVEQAVLLLRGRRVARRRSGRAARRPTVASTAATATGGTSTTPTSSRCPTSGSTRGTPRGTWRSTAFRWQWSTPTSPSASWC